MNSSVTQCALTAGQRRVYLRRGGSSCPCCGSLGIEGTGKQVAHDDGYNNEIHCVVCAATWNDIYTLTDVELVVGPAKPVRGRVCPAKR